MYRFIDENGEHLHTFNGQPLIGTTTATQILAKPLTWWAAGEACKEFGWTHPKYTIPQTRVFFAKRALDHIKSHTPEQFLARLDAAYSAHDKRKRTAAKGGTDLHAELERYVGNCLAETGGVPVLASNHPAVQDFSGWAIQYVKQFLWSEAHCYSETLWVGGISDCGAVLKDGKTAVIDFKSSKEAYFDHFVQAGGYAQQIEENGIFTSEGAKMGSGDSISALIVFPFGGGSPKIVYDVEGYQRAFTSALALYKLKQSFDQS